MNLSPSNPVSDKDATTPMLAHYKAVKAAHPDALVFYRMGDFYELFYDDAIKAAEALGITLTKRGKQAGEDVPMCGVPVHSVDGYLARLIKAGFRVAVCEQMEDPAEAKKRGGKTLVRRDVVRIVTPGTITEENLLDARRHNYLAALAEAQSQLGFAWLDLSTGDFRLEAVERSGIAALLARLEPKEMLLPEKLLQATDLFETFRDWKSALTPLPGSRFDSENARLRLQQTYGVATLDAFGNLSRAELAAAGALLDYVELTQKGKLPHLSPPRRSSGGDAMAIDASTRRSLELTQTMSGERKGSLLSVVDETVTGAGARLLASRLSAPLTDPAAIGARLDMVAYFHGLENMRADLRDFLKSCPDLERALARLTLGRGGPRDVAGIRDGLTIAGAVRGLFDRPAAQPLAAGVGACAQTLGHHESLIDRLRRALAVDLPLLARDGGFIAPGYSPGLDEQRSLRDESRRVIAELEARYRAESGIASLKIRHNNVLGFFIEVTTTHADKMKTGAGAPFIRRQTIASAARYTSVELSELDDKISRAGDRALAIELALFADLVKEIEARADAIAATARALAALDVAAALAHLAQRRRYTRPVVDGAAAFEIKAGRHPVVEALLEEPFITNDCTLGPAQRVWLVTGPNMAGKSTFLRQNALIAILAQIGSFVPAEAAHIGIVDRLFSRVGAADDLARGRSTFMVEMVETASILNQAGPRALVILDEIGRGTATFDGLSIAWATLEQLHDANRCRTLFATHYHELTALAAKLPQLSCHTMRVKEWRGDVVFLHEVTDGNADRSYGIHVARLAGLPAAVIARAEQVLALLEKGEQSGTLARLADDLPLFSAARPKGGNTPAASRASELEQAVLALNPDELSPKDALDALYKLKALAKQPD